MNILKMQNGGGMPPFTYYQPIAVNTQQPQQVVSAPSSRNAGTTKNNDLNDKDLMEMLGKIDGLPSDMDKVYNMLSTFYQDKDLGLSTASLSTTYLKALQLLKTAKFNKEQYENAYDTVSKNKGLNEIAINQHGQIVTRDMSDGSMKFLTADQYLANRDKYVAMTNQELLQMRSSAPDYAYQNGVFNVVNNGIGLETIDKLVQQYMYELGENSVTNGGYLRNKDAKTLHSLEVVQSAVQQAKQAGYNFDSSGITLEGLYKTKLITKDQAQQASNALNYIYQMLPDNAKTLLKVKAGGAKQAIDLLTSFVSGQTDHEYNFDPELLEDKDGNKPGSKNSTGGSQNDVKSAVAAQWYQGYGSNEDIVLNGGTTYAVQAKSFVMPIVSKENDPLGQCDLSQIQSSQFGPMFDIQNASFGGNFIPNASWNKILTDGQVYSVDFPVDLEALSNGKIKPDLNISKKLEQLNQYIRENNINESDHEKINQLCEQFGLPLKYDSSGNYNFSQWRRFAVLNATALGNAFTEDQTFNDYVSEILDENTLDGYIKLFEKSQGFGEGKFKYDKPGLWDNLLGNPQNILSTNDQMFRGTLYIPVRDSMFNAMAGSGSVANLEQGTLQDIESREQQKQRIQNYNNPGEFKL